MNSPTRKTSANEGAAAPEDPNVLDARVPTVILIGEPGCGKTSLISATLHQLHPPAHIGVICANGHDARNVRPPHGGACDFVWIDVQNSPLGRFEKIQRAVRELDVSRLDLLLIESNESLRELMGSDWGTSRKVVVLSVAAGDEQPDRYSDVIAAADALVLNKTDLLSLIPFDFEAFSAAARRINPSLKLFSVSVKTGEGLDGWIDWLIHVKPS